MALDLFFRNLIVGRKNFIASRGEYKTTILRGQLALVLILVCALYIVIDWLNEVKEFEKFYLCGIAISSLVFYLNRVGKYLAANIIFLTVINALVFLFATNDHYKAGTYMHFINVALAAVALFGYRNRWMALIFCLLSFTLFWIGYEGKLKLLELSAEENARVYAESYIRTTFIINFSVSLLISSSILFFLIDVNNTSEQELMKANDLLSKTNKELDRFVYSASHDLKAPLSSVLGLIEIAQRTDDPEEMQACLSMMKSRVNNLDGFIKDITDHSRNSRLEVKKERINLLSLVKDLVDGLRYAEGFESIYFKYNIAPDLEIKTDKARLKVVLNNLVANALKYHDANKDQPLIEISAHISSGVVEINVSDNGLGIDEAHIGSIFQMFYRASEKSTGSGLGLYIVKESLEKLSGNIAVESTLHVGSAFKVTLPHA